MKSVFIKNLSLTALLCSGYAFGMDQTPTKPQKMTTYTSPANTSSPELPRTLYSPEKPRIWWENQFPGFHYDSPGAQSTHSLQSPHSFISGASSTYQYTNSPAWSISPISTPASSISLVSTPASSNSSYSFYPMPNPQGRALRFSQPFVGRSLAIPMVQQQVQQIAVIKAVEARIQAAVAQENARRMQEAFRAIMAEGQRRINRQNNIQWSYK
jgi:hypothetical protein